MIDVTEQEVESLKTAIEVVDDQLFSGEFTEPQVVEDLKKLLSKLENNS